MKESSSIIFSEKQEPKIHQARQQNVKPKTDTKLKEPEPVVSNFRRDSKKFTKKGSIPRVIASRQQSPKE